MSRNRARKRRERAQNVTSQQDVTQPARRVSSSYMKRWLGQYHRTTVAPLFVQSRLTDATVAALCRLLKERDQLPGDFALRIGAEMDRLGKDTAAEVPEPETDLAGQVV